MVWACCFRHCLKMRLKAYQAPRSQQFEILWHRILQHWKVVMVTIILSFSMRIARQTVETCASTQQNVCLHVFDRSTQKLARLHCCKCWATSIFFFSCVSLLEPSAAVTLLFWDWLKLVWMQPKMILTPGLCGARFKNSWAARLGSILLQCCSLGLQCYEILTVQ